ncbi:MAG: hypothetical protein ACJAS1_006524 [Oleiphilaceae bacterium]|jgi:hypothetical protein
MEKSGHISRCEKCTKPLAQLKPLRDGKEEIEGLKNPLIH